MTEDLDKQIKEISKKLRERDEAARKQGEKDWRDAMAKDTAGHVLGLFQYTQAQIASLQAQLDASNPLAPIVRTIDAIAAKLAEMDNRLVSLEKIEVGRKE